VCVAVMGQVVSRDYFVWGATPATSAESSPSSGATPSPNPVPFARVSPVIQGATEGVSKGLQGVFDVGDPLLGLLLKVLCCSLLVFFIVVVVAKTVEILKTFAKNVAVLTGVVAVVLAVLIPNATSLTTVVCSMGLLDVLPFGWGLTTRSAGFCSTAPSS
jgi:hypothetical protein